MIRVNDDYVIDVDAMNYTVKIDKHKTNIDKNGKENNVFVIVGYYSTLEGALEAIKDDMCRNCLSEGEMMLDEALNAVKRVNKDFVDTFNRVLAEN